MQPELSIPWDTYLALREEGGAAGELLTHHRWLVRFENSVARGDVKQVCLKSDPARTTLYFSGIALASIPAQLAPYKAVFALDAGDQGLGDLLDLLDHLTTHNELNFVLKLDQHRSPEAAMVLVSLGYPVRFRFDGLEEKGRAAFVEVLDYFLHAKALNQPVEPYFSLLRGELRSGRSRPNVWGINREQIGSNFHVTPDAEVSLSAKLASQGVCFGALRAGLEAWKGSDAFQRLSRWSWVLREHNSPCATCEVFKMCGGYFADYQTPDQVNCEVEKAALLELATSASVLRQATDPKQAGETP